MSHCATCRCQPAARCVCTHLELVHDLGKDNRTRKACGTSSGAQGVACGCRSYSEREVGNAGNS